MRIEKVTLQNLNSLYGTHEINFLDPAFQENNLFLLWGDMGSGKTTVLDAITLALFGRTPRLNKVNKSNNDIISQGTRKCSAEVIFSLNGKRYMARWSQEINRNNHLNEQKREFCVLAEEGNQILETRTDSINERIQDTIKLNYDQFTKAVMLEQNGFTAFLMAKPDDRALILEQLTNTEIYSNISVHAYNRAKEERLKYENAQKEAEGIILLTPQQLEELKQREADHLATSQAIKAANEKVVQKIAWLEKIHSEQAQLDQIIVQKQALHDEVCAFEPQKEILRLGKKAECVANAYDNFISAEKWLKEAESGLQKLRDEIPRLEEIRVKAENNEKKAAEENAAIRLKEQECAPLFIQVRKLQTEHRAMRDACLATQKRLNECRAQLAECTQMANATKEKQQSLAQRKEKADIFFQDHAADKNLVEEFNMICEQCKHIEETAQQRESAAKAVRDAQTLRLKTEKNIEKEQNNLLNCRAESNRYAQLLDSARDELSKACGSCTLEELEIQRDNLRKDELKAQLIASFEEKRQELREGTPCPLCGATQHPYCHGTPQISALSAQIQALDQTITAIRDTRIKVEASEDIYTKSLETLKTAELSLQSLQNTLDLDQTRCNEKTAELQNIDESGAAMLDRLNGRLTGYGLSVSHSTELASLCNALGVRKKQWLKAIEIKEQLDKDIAETNRQLVEQNSKLEWLTKNAETLHKELIAQQNTQAQKQQEINDIFGDRDVDREENNLRRERIQVEQNLKNAQSETNNARIACESAQTAMAERTENVQKRRQNYCDCQNTFAQSLAEQQFDQIESFLKARLDNTRLEQLQIKSDELETKNIKLESLLRNANQKLEELRRQNLSEQPIEELKNEKQTQDEQLEQLTRESGAIHRRLEENKENEERFKRLFEKCQKAKEEYHRWNRLSELIGSADGKKYRTFAQGLTFNILVENANKYLQDKKLMERYELTKALNDLEFRVHDYQTGNARSAQNMSGGEKFCLSLALALALAEMASNNVCIDSLFIDEGLGTLDDQTLDVALTMLQNLSASSQGKLIGLISHVTRAKEAISTRIVAEKLGGGRSRLTGPGCRYLSSGGETAGNAARRGPGRPRRNPSAGSSEQQATPRNNPGNIQ